MADTPAQPQNPSTPQSSSTTQSTPAPQPGSRLQWFRECITAGISVVILAVAAYTLIGTWNTGSVPKTDPAEDTAQKAAYERQKDIMLYALALLGTVTGYYLGRVPAELHAQQAHQSANAAQQQLQETQTKLTDTAGSAAKAAGQLSVVQTEKDQAQKKVQDAKAAVNGVLQTLTQKVDAHESRMATLAVGAPPPPPDPNVDAMKQAKDQLERVLQQIGS